MNRTIIVITTRDYPCKHCDEFTCINIPNVENIMKKYVDLRDEYNIKRLMCRVEDPSEIDEFPEVARRVLVWEHERASWCKDANYFENIVLVNGLKIINIHPSLKDNDETEFYVFVGPCTNGQGTLRFKREYTLAMLLTAIGNVPNFKKNEDSVILVAHDKDVVDESGSGLITQPIFEKCDMASQIPSKMKMLKYKHEEEENIWKTIIRPIRDNNLSYADCTAFVSLVGSYRDQDMDLSSYDKANSVLNSYLSRVDKELLKCHYPELFF